MPVLARSSANCHWPSVGIRSSATNTKVSTDTFSLRCCSHLHRLHFHLDRQRPRLRVLAHLLDLTNLGGLPLESLAGDGVDRVVEILPHVLHDALELLGRFALEAFLL